MKLSHPVFSEPFSWESGEIHTLVVENPSMYRSLAADLIGQCSGIPGNFVFSIDNAEAEFSKHVDVVSDLFSADVCEKRILNGLHKELSEMAVRELTAEVNDTYIKINELLSEIIFQSGLELIHNGKNDISSIMKLYDLRPDTSGLSLCEKILQYMELSEKYRKTKLFILFHVNAFFSEEELLQLFRAVQYRKINILCYERYDSKCLEPESKLILDEDLCEI